MATVTRNSKSKKKKPKRTKQRSICVPALEVTQGSNRKLYSFAVDGKLLHDFCAISRVSRHDGEGLNGYQRPEVVSHIVQIREYLESDNPILPNAIVVAFDESVKFKANARKTAKAPYSRTGSIEIPLDPEGRDSEKPGWIVDGQQRAAALRDARVQNFPVCVIGFIADGLEEQRQQFILVNATKPLPKGLIYELLPSTEGKLPLALQKRRHPALISERLNYDDDSPLQGLIRTSTMGTGVIQDTSILKMVENSLSDGILFNHDDIEEQLRVLKQFWAAVKIVFPDAWGLLPRKSRLMHGAGVVAMGFLMDTIAMRHVQVKKKELTSRVFENDLKLLREVCHWTDGYWEFGPDTRIKFDDLQNIPKHVQWLTRYLLDKHRTLVWNRGSNGQSRKARKKKRR